MKHHEMERPLRNLERMENRLYEASRDGNTNSLLKLLQEDSSILDRVTLDHNGNTPLHIASMRGHVDFVKEVITRRPHLTIERDAQKRVPLHIASAKGHIEVVKELLKANVEACLECDLDGGNPVHIAAIKGHHEVVKVLVQARPHAARAMVQRETILHLCVKYNQLEVLKLLVETVDDHEFVNTEDADGNTILHLAVADKQIEAINFLLLDTTIQVNASNTNGETLMDILAKGPRDVKDQQIIWALKRAGVIDADYESLLEQISQKMNADWLDKKRNTLMVVASLLATMAFQAGINPPGGVWQDDDLTVYPPKKAGYAVMAYDYQISYHTFLVSNTVGFVSTISIILLLISGLPFLRRPFFMWVLIVIMWVATASMSLTYSISILALTPNLESHTLSYVVCGIMLVWFCLVTLLAVGHALQLLISFRNRWYHRLSR